MEFVVLVVLAVVAPCFKKLIKSVAFRNRAQGEATFLLVILHRAPIRDGLIVAVFRHYESRAVESKPLLHGHAVVSIRTRRSDGTWGNLSADSMLEHIVAAGTLYTLTFMEEVSARLGWAWSRER
ncbi:relaxase domain-containing protein [Streptomyces sp. NPDC002206]